MKNGGWAPIGIMMRKLTDFDANHAYEHVQSGCWSKEMFAEWVEAVKEKSYDSGYQAAETLDEDY